MHFDHDNITAISEMALYIHFMYFAYISAIVPEMYMLIHGLYQLHKRSFIQSINLWRTN